VDVTVGDFSQGLDVRSHQVSTEGAIESDTGGPGVGDRVPEGFDGLAKEGATAVVGDGGKDDRGESVAEIEAKRAESILP